MQELEVHPVGWILMITLNELTSRVLGMGFTNPDTRYKNIEVDDIPIMISGNYLVCIPNTTEVKHWGIIGTTGSCKSVFMNSQLSFRYWLQKRTCILLNDYQRETYDQSFESKNEEFIRRNKLINLGVCPSPLVFVFPSTKSLVIDDRESIFPIVKMTLPIDYAVKNIEQFHELDKSKLYLGNITDQLSECNSMTEIQECLEENFQEKEQKLMKFKMLNVFQDLFDNKLLNVSCPEADSRLTFKIGNEEYTNLTVQAIMRAGFIPSIQTSDLNAYEFFSPYMAYIVNSIYENQYYNPYFKKVTVNLFVDEIDKLWLGKNGSFIKQALGLIGTNGRMARIELCWATQDSNYDIIPPKIRSNTKYLVVTRMGDSKYVNGISRDFGVPKALAEELLNLRIEPEKGIFEAMCFTIDKFVLYDMTNGDKFYSRNPRKGFIIPPVAGHRRPK